MNRWIWMASAPLPLLALWLRAVVLHPLSYDEYFSLGLAQVPQLSEVWAVIRAGEEPHPPLHYLAQRLMLTIGASKEISFRLISLFGFLASCATVWFLVARETKRNLAGALAATILLASYLAELSMDGRPYALYCGLAALNWVAWDYASRTDLWWRVLARRSLFGLLLAALVSAHYYAFLLAAFFFLFDLAALLREPRRRWLPMLAFVPTAFLLCCYLPWIRASSLKVARIWQDVPHYVYATTASQIWLVMAQHLLPCALPVLIGAGLAAAIPSQRAVTAGGSSTGLVADRRMLQLFLAYPFLIFLIGWTWTNVYFARYAAPGLLGYAFAGAIVAVRLESRMRKPVVAWALAMSAVFVLGLGPLAAWRQPAQPGVVLSKLLGHLPDTVDVVIANPFDFPQYSFYASSPVRPRLVYLADPILMRTFPDPIPETMLSLLKRWMPLRVENASAYLLRQREFALVTRRELAPGEWLPRRLQQSNWNIRSMKCIERACVALLTPMVPAPEARSTLHSIGAGR